MTETTEPPKPVFTELELVTRVLDIFPNAEIVELDGEIVVKTRMTVNQDGILVDVGGP